jgi:hypothetical protein
MLRIKSCASLIDTAIDFYFKLNQSYEILSIKDNAPAQRAKALVVIFHQ